MTCRPESGTLPLPTPESREKYRLLEIKMRLEDEAARGPQSHAALICSAFEPDPQHLRRDRRRRWYLGGGRIS